ncbi:YhcN/YlaJ family sporulation lipoprotein [Bacillus massilinigeriensis]|uniref:YhcN/YlaJ family sporulation lipoprotein n=1 Tax=Bacillus mediterraneensis TaxID=1805474 RepID=UPI0008F8A84A|nr:YhcN/YlaJ family sporulation lipoprotein [Bacillus mediterraneensis]
MKKGILVSAAISGILLAGCAADDSAKDRDGNNGIFEESGNTINKNDGRADILNRDDKAMNDKGKNFGYVRHQKSGILGDDQLDADTAIDREKTADTISKFCLQTPDVDDVSTLVTDEEVLIVYKTDSKDRNETADQVKKMAMSVIPRWYHVYVTDDPSLRKDVENFASLNTNSRDVEILVDGVVKQMLKSPQGEKMSTGENENGEAQGEMNEKMDKDDIGEETRKKQQ